MLWNKDKQATLYKNVQNFTQKEDNTEFIFVTVYDL